MGSQKDHASDALVTHDNEKPFKCTTLPKCSAAFARRNDLVRHLQSVHGMGEKRFLCQGPLKLSFQDNKTWGCGKAFPRADALAAHFRSEASKKCIKPLRDEQALLKEWEKQPSTGFEVNEDFINSIINYQTELDTWSGALHSEAVDIGLSLPGSSQETEGGSGSPD